MTFKWLSRKIFAPAITLMFATLSLSACAQDNWQEGKHYEVIANNVSSEKNITEFFSFWCPACYNFEPLVNELKNQLPDNVAFQKIHVNFMGFSGPDTQNLATRTMMVGRLLEQETKVNTAIFEAIHRQRQNLLGIEDFKQVATNAGIASEQFDKTQRAFAVNSMLMRNNKRMQEFRGDVSGVPTFIVNDKYKATFTRDMTPDQIVDLLLWLVEQP